MTKIYYRNYILCGAPFVNKFVNSTLIEYILQYSLENSYEIPDAYQTAFFGLKKNKLDTFKYVLLNKETKEVFIESEKYYSIESLVFYDSKKEMLSDNFYFIGKIHDQIELREATGKDNTLWKEALENHSEVRQNNIIQKITNTLIELEKIVTLTRKIEEERLFIQESSVIEKRRYAFKNFIDLCMSLHFKRDAVIQCIDKLSFDESSECDELDQLIECLNQNNITFLSQLEKNTNLEDVEWMLTTSLHENFHINTQLIFSVKQGHDVFTSYNWVIEDINDTLKVYDLETGFIEKKDKKYIFIHKKKYKKIIENIIREMGYRYSTML